jgi:hypothetical protein
MENKKTVPVKSLRLRLIVRQGYLDAIDCHPIPRDYDTWDKYTQMNYEKGRHLASYCLATGQRYAWRPNAWHPVGLNEVSYYNLFDAAIRQNQPFTVPSLDSLMEL